MKFSRDQVFEWLIRLTKGKETTRQIAMNDRHLNSENMTFGSITKEGENEFHVKSEFTAQRSYMVTLLLDRCEVSNCTVKCTHCNVCPHTFQCTCTDFLIQTTSCKHVHLVKRYIDSQTSSNHPMKEINTASEIAETFNIVRQEKPKQFEEFNTCKSKIESQLNFLQAELQSCTSVNIDAMKHLQKNLVAVTNTFESLLRNNNILKMETMDNFPANKNIEVQNKFASVAKRKRKSRIRFAKRTERNITRINVG